MHGTLFVKSTVVICVRKVLKRRLVTPYLALFSCFHLFFAPCGVYVAFWHVARAYCHLNLLHQSVPALPRGYQIGDLPGCSYTRALIHLILGAPGGLGTGVVSTADPLPPPPPDSPPRACTVNDHCCSGNIIRACSSVINLGAQAEIMAKVSSAPLLL